MELIAAVEQIDLQQNPGQPAPPELAFSPEKFKATIGDPDLLGELITIYAEDTPDMVAAISRALEQGDTEAVHSAAHALKSQ